MTKKHFQAIADALNGTKPYVPQGEDARALTHDELSRRLGALRQWKEDVQAVRRVLAASNPRFDSGRFLEACGYVPGDV